MTDLTKYLQDSLDDGECCLTLTLKHNGQLHENSCRFSSDDLGNADRIAAGLTREAQVVLDGGFSVLSYEDLRVFARKDGTAALQFARGCGWESLTEHLTLDAAMDDFSAAVKRAYGGAQ